jgi:hypothetical protein
MSVAQPFRCSIACLSARPTDEHLVDREPAPVAREAAFRAPDRTHHRLDPVALRETLLVRCELTPHRLGACAHTRRRSRCAIAPRSVCAMVLYCSPMSARRATALTASLACTVVSTRWPVMAACAAVTAVSLSRISPTRMTSGSWRSIARSALAKVMPCFVCTCVCVMPGSSYSIGSSTVMMLTLPSASSRSAPYSVVVFPEPVGPGHDDDPVSVREEVAEPLELVLRDVEVVERERGARVEHPDDALLRAHPPESSTRAGRSPASSPAREPCRPAAAAGPRCRASRAP